MRLKWLIFFRRLKEKIKGVDYDFWEDLYSNDIEESEDYV